MKLDKDEKKDKIKPSIIMLFSACVIFIGCIFIANITHFSFVDTYIIKIQHFINEGILHCYYDMELYEHNESVTDAILPDKIYEQIIVVPDKMAGHDTIAVSIKMATYARVNTCTLNITLSQDENECTLTVNASEISDNSYNEFVFENVDWLEPGEASISVSSDNAENGNAITLYYSDFLLFYDYMLVNGKATVYNLCMKIYIPA